MLELSALCTLGIGVCMTDPYVIRLHGSTYCNTYGMCTLCDHGHLLRCPTASVKVADVLRLSEVITSTSVEGDGRASPIGNPIQLMPVETICCGSLHSRLP